VILGARTLQHALFALAASGLFACVTILGIEDRNLDTQGTDASMNTPLDGSVDTTTDASRDLSTDAPMDASTDMSIAVDVSADRDGALDGAVRDGGADADASSTTDSPFADAPASEAASDAASCPDPCVLATGLNHPFLMTSDSTGVYWSEFGDALGSGNGYVKGCPVTGCGAGPTVYAQGLANPRGVAVDSTNIYFGAGGAIYTCPRGGCNGGPTQLVSANQPYGVAVDGTYVYWVDYADSTVHRTLKSAGSGGIDTVLYDAGDGLVYQPFQCVVDGTFLYFMDYNEDVTRLSVNGGAIAFLGSGNNGSRYGNSFGITTDPTSVYFGGNSVVQRADKTLADSGVPISATIPDADSLAFDPATGMIYWSNWGSGNSNDGTIGKMTVTGGSAQVLTSSLATPEAVTVSGNYVLWLSNGTLDTTAGVGTLSSTGALLRRAK
jgi:hypothetical protein